jgi:hypothetical protein
MRHKLIDTLKLSLAALLLASPLAARQSAPAEPSLAEKVDAAIRSSVRYGPFDLISFEVTGDTVTLGGNVYRATLREESAKNVAAVPGVSRVVNAIEILPVSFEDDRLRRAVFSRIYRDGFLAKYGTPSTALGLSPWGGGRASRLLGAEPFGNYAIHVVVKGGRVTLYGLVNNDVDRRKAALDARGVFGVMGLENRIEVLPKTTV